MKKFLDAIPEVVFDIAIILLVVILLYVIGARIVQWLVGRLFKRAYKHRLHAKDLEKRQNTLKGLAANIWKTIVVFVGILAIARLFLSAEELAPVFASAGILGVAFGFGAQSLVKDFLSGIFIISENQYRVGDVIEIDGFGGTVERIGSRSTVLRDVEGNVHYFPNGIIQHVINKTMGYSNARVTISIVPDADIDEASAIINAIGNDMLTEDAWKNKIIEAPQYVMMGDISATSVELIVSGKVQPSDQWAVSAELRRRILQEFEKSDIDFGVNANAATVVSQGRRKR